MPDGLINTEAISSHHRFTMTKGFNNNGFITQETVCHNSQLPLLYSTAGRLLPETARSQHSGFFTP